MYGWLRAPLSHDTIPAAKVHFVLSCIYPVTITEMMLLLTVHTVAQLPMNMISLGWRKRVAQVFMSKVDKSPWMNDTNGSSGRS